ncbi:MAG: DUF6134 family protein [Desulfovibrio sp.]
MLRVKNIVSASIAGVCGVLIMAGMVWAGANQYTRTVDSSLDIDGYEIGETTTKTIFNGSSSLKVVTSLNIDTSDYALEGATAHTWQHGELTGMYLKYDENGEKTVIVGSRVNEAVHMNYALADGGSESAVVDTDDFDCVYENLPQYLHANNYPATMKRIRLFDPLVGDSVVHTATSLGIEDIKVNGITFSCRKYAIKEKNRTKDSEDIQLWIASDDLGGFVVKEEVDSSFGLSVQLMTKYSLTGNAG